MKKNIILFCLGLSLCFSTLALAETVQITSKDAIKYLTEPLPNMVFLDIRTPQEYAAGHIPGAILIDFYSPQFKEKLDMLDRDAPYVLYCRTGNRSGRSLQILNAMGFTQIYHMRDGIIGWNTNDFPLRYGQNSQRRSP